MQKNGIVKVYWDEQTDVTKEEYQELNEEELTLLLADQEVEVVSQDMIPVDMPEIVDPVTGVPVPEDDAPVILEALGAPVPYAIVGVPAPPTLRLEPVCTSPLKTILNS